MQLKIHKIIILLLNLFPIHLSAQEKDLEESNSIKSIPSLKEACKKYDKKVLLNVDLAYYFKDCSLHLINDPHLLNMLIKNHGKETLSISPKAYAALPLKKDYTIEDYNSEFAPQQNAFSISICKEFNNKIVSEDDYSFYYIDACKKRKFDNYDDVNAFNKENLSILAISPYQLALLPNGKPMPVAPEIDIIKEKSEIELKKNSPKKDVLCKNLNNKIVSFYESFFYIEKCMLYPINDFTIEIQFKAQQKGGIQELTVEQMLGLEEGKKMSSEEVLKRIKEK